MPADTLVEPTTEVNADLEAMFQQSIPCQHCPEPAVWRSFGHRVNDCGRDIYGAPPFYLCQPHYEAWLRKAVDDLSDGSFIECKNCARLFSDPHEFSDYKRF